MVFAVLAAPTSRLYQEGEVAVLPGPDPKVAWILVGQVELGKQGRQVADVWIFVRKPQLCGSWPAGDSSVGSSTRSTAWQVIERLPRAGAGVSQTSAPAPPLPGV